jgi:hypothetical protein
MTAKSIATRTASITKQESASTNRRPATARVDQPAPPADERGVRQLGLGGIIAVWAAAALPMGLLAWIVAPLLADHLSGPSALTRALLIALTAGLVWRFLLVLILVRRERVGSVSRGHVLTLFSLRALRELRNSGSAEQQLISGDLARRRRCRPRCWDAVAGPSAVRNLFSSVPPPRRM